MDRKRDKYTGRFVKTPDPNRERIFNFRVTDREYQLIKDAQKRGLQPRDVILQEAKKVVTSEI